MKTCSWIGNVIFENQTFNVFELIEQEYGFTDIEVLPVNPKNEKNLLLIAGQIELCAISGILEGKVWNFTRFETPVEQK